MTLQAFWRDWRLARALRRRRATRRRLPVVTRRADGTLWAAGHPQSFAYAMRGLTDSGRLAWHFWRVRHWHGVLVASRRTFWLAASAADFELRFHAVPLFVLAPWPEPLECAKIDAQAAA